MAHSILMPSSVQAVSVQQNGIYGTEQGNPSKGFEQRGRPRSRTSGGARSDCLAHVIALVPGNESVEVQPGGCISQSESSPTVTLTDTPTFWFYLPGFAATNVAGEFVLLDENEQPIAVEHISLPTQAGVIGVRLSQPLEPNRSYFWIFSVLLNPRSPSQNPVVEGVVQLAQPNAAVERQRATLAQLDRAEFYRQNEFWQDALTELGAQHCTDSQNTLVTNAWATLLQSVGLGAIANAALLNCDTFREAAI